MVARLRMDEPNSGLLAEDYRYNRKYYDRSHYSLHRVQEWSLHCLGAIPLPSWIHCHRGHSLRSHFVLFVGTNAGYRRGKVDIRLPPGLCVNKILPSIPCWKMPRIFCLVNSHVYGISGVRCWNLVVSIRSRDSSRGHTSLALPVRSCSYCEHIRFYGARVLAGGIRYFCVKIRVGAPHLRLGPSDGFLGSTIPCHYSSSSFFRHRKCSSIYRVH